MASSRATIVAIGRVQGVFYRKTAVSIARELGLVGYARNMPDGTVEMVAEGERSRIEQLVEWARQGPTHAHVDDVRVSWEEPKGDFAEFRVRHI